MRDKYLKYLLLTPGISILFFVTLWPITQAIRIGFMDWRLSRSQSPTPLWSFSEDGLSEIAYLFDHFINAFNDSLAINSFYVTTIYGLASVILTIALSMGLALLLFKGGFFRSFARSILLLPFAMSPALVGISWKFLFNPDFGLFSTAIGLVFPGMAETDWLGDANLALLVVVLSDVWHWSPYITLLLIGGLASISPEVLEAGKIDGAGGWHSFIHIILPLMIPALSVSLVLKAIFSLKMFDQVYMLTNGGPSNATQTLSHYIYTQGFKYYDMGYASALSYFLILPMMLLAIIYIKLIFRKQNR